MALKLENKLLANSERKINVKKLNKNQYIISIFKEAIKIGLMNENEIIRIQVDIMNLLKDLILRYTKGESTSVTVETSESLINSILYAIDFYMLKMDSPEAAVMELKQKSIRQIYENGIELIRACIIDTKKLYGRIKRNKLRIELEPYNTTIEEISCFFEEYNIVFGAHNGMGSIDYPLVFDDMTVRGVSYIKNYLEHLEIETEFCRLFSEEDINKILVGYEKMCRLSHNIELINIFEILINNSIFSVLCGNKARQLNITKYQFNKINEKLKSVTNIDELINEAVNRVVYDLKIKNKFLIGYIDNYKKLFEKRLISVLENDRLDIFIVVESKEEVKYTFVFDEGKRMSEGEFNSMVKRIMKVSKIEDKIEIINSNIHSLQDFIDIFNCDCFFGEEFENVFNSFSDIELTIFVKVVFYEELRNEKADLSTIISQKRDVETEWQEYFIKFMEGLCRERVTKIEEMLDKVDYEEIKFY
ncbi:DUF6179 domain-containing protein [Clostridium neuense]|uniref:DUF6179 domain-containing protein n=1 Tax=Clostridium neuense TaxID=1728934 RepID=A0ABW8T8E2_9CLOT